MATNFAPGGYAGLDANKIIYLANLPMADAADVAAGTAIDKLPSIADVKSMVDAKSVDAYTKSQTDNLLNGKVDKIEGKGLSTNDYTTPEKEKLASLTAETAASIKAKYESNDDTNAFTDAEKEKLAGLEDNYWKGEYTSLTALQEAYPIGQPGWTADVDSGTLGEPITRYIWDNTDQEWVPQSGASTGETASSIKIKYESNPDTNAFTDALKDKLDNLDADAEKNQNAFSEVQIGTQAGAAVVIADTTEDKFTITGDSSTEITAAGKVITVGNKAATFEQAGVLKTMSNLDINSMTIDDLKNIKDRIMTPETVIQLVYRIMTGDGILTPSTPDIPTP